jgi:hypothetical protein
MSRARKKNREMEKKTSLSQPTLRLGAERARAARSHGTTVALLAHKKASVEVSVSQAAGKETEQAVRRAHVIERRESLERFANRSSAIRTAEQSAHAEKGLAADLDQGLAEAVRKSEKL